MTIFSDVCRKSSIELNKVEVNVSAKARKELLDGAWRRTEANCPVTSIFTEPIPVKVEFEVEE